MKTPAIIASLTVAGSVAFAAGQQSGGRQSPVMPPSGSRMHSMQEGMPQGRSQMTAECTQGADKNWFTTGHLLPSCATITGWEVLSRPDVNGDGVPEIMLVAQGFEQFTILVNNSPSAVALVSLHECSTAGGSYSETISSVIRGQAGAYFKSQVPSASDAFAVYFLRDMDGDGDMDLVFDSWGDGAELKFWLENTGYEKPAPPLAADLNGDGQVDGADLGLLLVAWSPNP